MAEGWSAMPEDQPRSCSVCGERILMKDTEPIWFNTARKITSHFYCVVKP